MGVHSKHKRKRVWFYRMHKYNIIFEIQEEIAKYCQPKRDELINANRL